MLFLAFFIFIVVDGTPGTVGGKVVGKAGGVTCPSAPHFTSPGHYCLGKDLYLCQSAGHATPSLVAECLHGCTVNGVGVPDSCQSQGCASNEQYTFCSPPECFEASCVSPIINPHCQFARPNPFTCRTGCRCKPGFVRNLQNKCVQYLACPQASQITCPNYYTGFKGVGAYCLNTDLHYCLFPGQTTPPVAQYCPLGCTIQGRFNADKCVAAFSGANQGGNKSPYLGRGQFPPQGVSPFVGQGHFPQINQLTYPYVGQGQFPSQGVSPFVGQGHVPQINQMRYPYTGHMLYGFP